MWQIRTRDVPFLFCSGRWRRVDSSRPVGPLFGENRAKILILEGIKGWKMTTDGLEIFPPQLWKK